jgi:CheY-like chemotaxis protein
MVPESPLVLIVDDNDWNRKLARDVLRAARIRTLEAVTAAEGVALATEHLPDLVLMDLRLPDSSGAEAVRRLRSQPGTAHIPVLAMTALVLDPLDGWLVDAGFDGYVAKPVDPDTLPDLARRHAARLTD